MSKAIHKNRGSSADSAEDTTTRSPGSTSTPYSSTSPSTPASDSNEREIDIFVSNVICTFSLGHPIDLKHLARSCLNARHDAGGRLVFVNLKRPHRINCKVWASGRVVCTGSQSEAEAREGAARAAKLIRNLGFRVDMTRPRIVNAMLTCAVPYAIDLEELSRLHAPEVFYNAEYHVSASWRIAGATLKVFTTGSVSVLAPGVDAAVAAVGRFYDLTHRTFSSPPERGGDSSSGQNDGGSKC